MGYSILRFWPGFLLLFLINCSFVSVAQTEIDVGYDSKYISEGRNNLVSGGIVWTTINHQLNSTWLIGAAYGNASDSSVDYNEFNAKVEFSGAVEDLIYNLSYTHLAFFADNQRDNEFGLSATWQSFRYITPTIDLVYSTQSRGTFIELTIATDHQLNNKLLLSPYGKISFDFGYASENFDGHNHYSAGTSLSYQLSQQLKVIFIAEYTHGGSYLKELHAQQSDQTWAGVHLNLLF